jgi:tetratricopeptide (TPR) repeat protein
VGEIALKALNKDPRARYAMIGDLARVLETLVLRLSAVELGIRLYHDRRFEAAALVLEEAAKGPDPLRAWIYLGKTYGEGLQDYEKGMVAFRRALKENPELVMAKEGLADHYARFGHFTLAKKEILDLLAKNADNVLLHFRYGTILRQEHDAAAAKGDLKAAQAAADSALNVFRKTRSLNPYFLPAYIQAVRLERERGKTAEAEAECREVLDVIAKVIRFGNLNPAEVAAVYLEWARLTLLRRMPERAVVWARKAVEAWPRHGESHTLLAELYLEAGEQEKAVPHLLAALALSGNQKSILERLSRLMNRPPGAST